MRSSSSLRAERLRFFSGRELGAGVFVVGVVEDVGLSFGFRGPLLIPGRPRPNPLPEDTTVPSLRT